MGTGATLVVAKALIQGTQVEFVVDQVIERELEGSGLDLFAQHHRQQPGAAIEDFARYGAMPARGIASTMAALRTMCRRYAQPASQLRSAGSLRHRPVRGDEPAVADRRPCRGTRRSDVQDLHSGD